MLNVTLQINYVYETHTIGYRMESSAKEPLSEALRHSAETGESEGRNSCQEKALHHVSLLNAR